MGHPAVNETWRTALKSWLWPALLICLAACQPFATREVLPTQSAQPLQNSPAADTTQVLPSRTPPAPTLVPSAWPVSSSTPVPTATQSPSPTSPPLSADKAASIQKVRSLALQPWELINALAWSPSGQVIAVAAGNDLRLYQVPALQQLASLEVGALTSGLDFSPDGTLLAAASHDGHLRIWDVQGLQEPTLLWELDAHKKGADQAVFSPDGRWLASSGNDAMARVWDLTTGKQVNQIIGGSFAVPGLAFWPVGTSLAMVNGPFVRLRDPASGRMLANLRAERPLFSLAGSLDHQYLAAGDAQKTIWLWSSAAATPIPGGQTYPPVQALPGTPGVNEKLAGLIWALAFSPDSSLLVSAGGDGYLDFWDLRQAKIAMHLKAGDMAITCLAFSPDGRTLATGGLEARLSLWQVVP